MTVTLPPWGRQRTTLNLTIPEASSAVVLEARIGDDAITPDNQIQRVVAVRQSLDVLLVDGHPSETLADSAAGFARLAIEPGVGTGSDLCGTTQSVPAVRMFGSRFISA